MHESEREGGKENENKKVQIKPATDRMASYEKQVRYSD